MNWNKTFDVTQKNKYWITIITILLTLILGYFAFKTQIDMGTYTLLPNDDDTVKQFNDVSTRFGGFDNLILIIDGEDTSQTKKDIEKLSLELVKLESVINNIDYKLSLGFVKKNVMQYIPIEVYHTFNETFEQDLIRNNEMDKTGVELQFLQYSSKKIGLNLTENETLNLLINEVANSYETMPGIELDDGYYRLKNSNKFLVLIRPTNPNHDMMFFKEFVQQVERTIETNKLSITSEVTLTGMAKMMEEQQMVLNKRLIAVTITSLVLIIIMFSVSYGSLLSSLIAATPVVVGITWTLGVNYLVIGRLNLITSIFSIIMLGLGIDFSIHFLTPLFDGLNQETIKVGRKIIPVLEQYFRSVFSGALTTAIAFFALGFSEFQGLKELAFVAGLGIVLTFISVVLFMLLVIPNIKLKGRDKQRITLVFARLHALLLRGKYYVLVVIVVISILPLFLNFNLGFNYNAFSLLPRIESVVLQENLIDRLGISLEYSIIQSDTVEEAIEVRKKLRELEHVGYVDSIANVLPMNYSEKLLYIEKWAEANRTNFSLKELLDSDLELLTRSRNTLNILPPEIKQKYFSADNKIATYVFGFPDSWEEEEMKELVESLNKVSPTSIGTPAMWIKIVDYLKRDLLQGSILVIIILVLIVAFDFKKIKAVLLVITPVTLGSILVIGTMSVFKLEFNAANIAALPLIIGIGIDDGIHMVHKYYGLANKDVLTVLKTTGKSVLITSLTTMIGFGSLYFVGDPLVSGLGLLLFLGVFYCLIISLTVLPILMLISHKETLNS